MSAGLFPSRRVMWLPLDYAWKPPSVSAEFCCGEMHKALAFDCTQHADPFECPDTLIVYHEAFQEYGLPVRDGGQSYLLISCCPFCGTHLPASGRDGWFDAVEAAGLDEVPFDALPASLKTGAWRAH